MNLGDECLLCLSSKNWNRLVKILNQNNNAKSLAELPAFSVFETVFIDELKRIESSTNDDLFTVATRIFQIHNSKSSSFTFSDKALYKLAEFLFDRDPQEKYAIILSDNPKAQEFLENHRREIQTKIDANILSANLNIKLGDQGVLVFDKEIFNSPQEKELYFAAKNIFPEYVLLPNISLSTIIDSKVCDFLDQRTVSYFYKATLDLCIVNPTSFFPEIFIELDSSWHDKPRNKDNDKMKDDIFKASGIQLHRLRKKENKDMTEVFELYIKNHYSS